MASDEKPLAREINRTCTIALGAEARIVYADGTWESLPPGTELRLRKVGRGTSRRLLAGISLATPAAPR